MKNARLYLLLFLASFVGLAAEGQPAYKSPLGLGSAAHLPCTFPITVGVKGIMSDNYMLYDAIKTAINKPSLSTGGGITVEWEYMKNFSVGLDVLCSARGAKKSFRTVFLLNYTTADFAFYDYEAFLRGVEVFVPLYYYKDVHFRENLTSMCNSNSKVYLFGGPELFIPIKGQMNWKRYYSDGTIYSQYHVDATRSTVRDYFGGLAFGVGFWHKEFYNCGSLFSPRKRCVDSYYIMKLDLSCIVDGNTFSEKEMKEEVENMYGWGDLDHETLGRRYGLNFRITATFLLPVRYKPSDACYGVIRSNML
jgi:hypothetical protein